METEKTTDQVAKNHCLLCNYKCSRNSEWQRHLVTIKHKYRVMETDLEAQETKKREKASIQKFVCSCGRGYINRSGLWKHKQKCNVGNNNTIEVNEQHIAATTQHQDQEPSNNIIILELIKQNNEFKQLLVEQTNKMLDIAKEPKVVNNATQNNQFNVQLFLNDKCKDAISADQFVENIQISFDDLENVGHSGYVKGITEIIMKQLNALALTERPFHCTDVKRETIYIKDNDAWNKDNEEKTKLKGVITKVAKKNLCKIKEWCKEHPDVHVLDSKDYELNHKIIRQSFGDGDEDKLNEKIIKNLAKEVHVDKSKVQ